MFSAYELSADFNSSIVLNCIHTGSPSPSISWLTPDNLSITNETISSKYKMINDSHLLIDSLALNDTGVYKCSAQNKFSSFQLRKKIGSVNLTIHC